MSAKHRFRDVQMAGIAGLPNVTPRDAALLLLDFQMEYFSGRLPLAGAPDALDRAARLTRWAEEHGISVCHIHHVSPHPGSNLFKRDGEFVAPHPGLAPKADHQVVVKHAPSAFHGTELEAWLRSDGKSVLIIAGLMTHLCVESTARQGAALGFRSIVVGDACATRDLPRSDGRGSIAAQVVHEAALAALADFFSAVTDCETLIQQP